MDYQKEFLNACKKGDLKLVKYLLELPNNNININSKNDRACRLACSKGHINIVKYLLELPNNNININDVETFTCSKGHTNVNHGHT